MNIRLAKQSDQAQIAELLLPIFLQMDLQEMQTMTIDEKIMLISKAFNIESLKTLAHFSVVEIDNQVVGISYGYDAGNEILIRERILKSTNGLDVHPDQEAWDGEWYLEMLAVDEAYRGHGIGKHLIENIILSAKINGSSKVSLNVDFDNQRANSLYKRQGFNDEKIIEIGNHHYYHMVKSIS